MCDNLPLQLRPDPQETLEQGEVDKIVRLLAVSILGAKSAPFVERQVARAHDQLGNGVLQLEKELAVLRVDQAVDVDGSLDLDRMAGKVSQSFIMMITSK